VIEQHEIFKPLDTERIVFVVVNAHGESPFAFLYLLLDPFSHAVFTPAARAAETCRKGKIIRRLHVIVEI